ncbi:hypothetical protein MPER_02556, partial [Moniliophthora perniciosa FA553]
MGVPRKFQPPCRIFSITHAKEEGPSGSAVVELKRDPPLRITKTETLWRLSVSTTPTLIPANFTGCSDSVGEAFTNSLDTLRESTAYISALLEHGVRVLLYVGTYDWICNWVGNERWTLELEWSGKEQFVKQELRDWLVDNKRAGRTRSWGNFTLATVNAAGHL